MIINIFWPENMGRVVAAVLSLPYLCILEVWASHEKISESIPNSNDSKPNDIYTQWRHKADRARASLGIWLTIFAWCYNKKNAETNTNYNGLWQILLNAYVQYQGE